MDMNKRPETMERITTPELAEAFIAEQKANGCGEIVTEI